MGWQTEKNVKKPSLKAGKDCKRLKSENGCGNGMFWSETGSGFGETGGTPYSPQQDIPKINLLFYGAVQETVSKIFFQNSPMEK